MRRIIRQSVVLPAPAEVLFDMYLDPESHAAPTGRPVSIGSEVGSEFRAFDGQLSGATLVVVRPWLIVQSWRSTMFRIGDVDSTLVLLFTPDESNTSRGRIDLVHLDVPEHDVQGVTEGWPKYYWQPWQNYLERA